MAISKEARQLLNFRVNPRMWFRSIWPDAALSNQQEQAMDEWGKLLESKIGRKNKKEFNEEYARKLGMSIMSGQGPGKDFIASILVWHFMYCFKNAKVICSAVTEKQLKNVLWSELAKWRRKSKKIEVEGQGELPILEYLFEMGAEKIYEKGNKGRQWFVESVVVNVKSSADEQAEALAGRHEDYMLFVLDEASGIPDAVFKPVEGTLTGAVNVVLTIFNPTRSKGFAIDSQYKDKDRWVPLRWNADETIFPDDHMTIAMQARNEQLAEKYGTESNPYRIRVLGLPPVADPDTLINPDWVMDAIDREMEVEGEPVIKGVDVGAGGDKSVILTRQGRKVTKISRFNTNDTMQLVGYVINEVDADEADIVYVDTIGIGKGVYDRLCERGDKVEPVDTRRSPNDSLMFNKLRDELWWKVREAFEKGLISIPNDGELIDQLISIKYKPESNGKIKVEGKPDMKRRGMSSPDEADALCCTFLYGDSMYRKKEKDRYDTRPKKKRWSKKPWTEYTGWMSR
jgi:hypothetical protein